MITLEEKELTSFKCLNRRCGLIFDTDSRYAPISIYCPACGKTAEWYEGGRPKLVSNFLGKILWLILSHGFCLWIGYRIGKAIGSLT